MGNASASDPAGLCIWPWNGAAISSGEQGCPEQGHQQWWGAGWAKAAWTAGHESLLAGPGSKAEAGARHDPSMKQLGMMVTHSAAWSSYELHSMHVRLGSPHVPQRGEMSLGLSLKPCCLPQVPSSQKGIRDFSKLVITSVFLS